MDREEFLAILRESLAGYIPGAEVEENIAFYRNYFQEAGKPEEEVAAELGDPRLIARSIIEAYKASKGPMADYYEEQARSEYSQSQAPEEDEGDGRKWERLRNGFILSGILLVVLLALAFLGTVIMYLLPVLLVILAVKLLWDFFER